MEIRLARFVGKSEKVKEKRSIFEEGEISYDGVKKGEELAKKWQDEVKAEGSDDTVLFITINR